jgi:hypothetical protein
MRISAIAVAVAACGPAGAVDRPRTRPAPTVVTLDVPVRGDTHDDDGWNLAICIGGGTAGVTSARGHRFEAPHTGSYRIELAPDYRGVVEVAVDGAGRGETVSCFAVPPGQRGGVTVAMRAGTAYHLIVDGELQARGRYELVVRRDDGAPAPVRDEDPAIRAPLCAAAPVLDGAAAATFVSVPGGLRASCGGTGSGAVHRVDIPAGGARLAVAAHFEPALEVRATCDAPPRSCDAAPRGSYEVTTAPLPAGSYLVVVDTTEIVARPADDHPGAGVQGAYYLEQVPP